MKKLKLYFNGACPICTKEMATLQKKVDHNKFEYIDISSPSFDAKKENIDLVAANKYFHIKDENGKPWWASMHLLEFGVTYLA